MNGASERDRRDALAERNEERETLHDMLSEEGRGGLSEERALALQETFKRKTFSVMPKSERGLTAEKRSRLEGLAEMAVARLKNSLIEEVEAEKEEEEPVSAGVTVSYSYNGCVSSK